MRETLGFVLILLLGGLSLTAFKIVHVQKTTEPPIFHTIRYGDGYLNRCSHFEQTSCGEYISNCTDGAIIHCAHNVRVEK